MMENSMVVIKLLKNVSNYLPNEMIFILQSEFLFVEFLWFAEFLA